MKGRALFPLEDFRKNGIGEKELAGRKDDSGLIIYAPLKSVNEQEYQLLASKDSFGIYKMKNEVAE